MTVIHASESEGEREYLFEHADSIIPDIHGKDVVVAFTYEIWNSGKYPELGNVVAAGEEKDGFLRLIEKDGEVKVEHIDIDDVHILVRIARKLLFQLLVDVCSRLGPVPDDFPKPERAVPCN